MDISPADIRFLALLARRLERLSADSRWAHRASGVRGQILRVLGELENGEVVERDRFQALIEAGFYILRRGAEELR
jgi:hypothetical protein